MSSKNITYIGRAKWSLTYSCHVLAMRCAFVQSAVAQRCVFAGLCTWIIYNMLYNIRLKLASASHILKKIMDAQRRTALIFVTQDVGCAPCMCDWGITLMSSRTNECLRLRVTKSPNHIYLKLIGNQLATIRPARLLVNIESMFV